MPLDDPRFVCRDELLALRPRMPPAARFAGLWVSGSLDGLEGRTVAVVGSRAPSEAGRRLAHETAQCLVGSSVCVISGLALGIDGAAHAGALEARGVTIGILGGGHRLFHPRRNRALAQAMIAGGGAVVSPFDPDHAALPPQFLQRNGIVAALADAVVIVEAAARSGALNTASWAADLGIPVFAFPGDVDRPKVAGCLALIRDGATLVRGGDDVLCDLGIARDVTACETGLPEPASPLEAHLLARLAEGEADVDALLEGTGAAIGAVLASLARLEILGWIERRPANRFAAVHSARARRRTSPRPIRPVCGIG